LLVDILTSEKVNLWIVAQSRNATSANH